MKGSFFKGMRAHWLSKSCSSLAVKASGRTLTSTDVPTIGLQSLQAHIGGSAPVPTIADAMGFHPWPASDARLSFIALFALP